MTLHNLARLYGQQGDHNRARAVFARAVGIFESSLGINYPKTARSRTELDALVTRSVRPATAPDVDPTSTLGLPLCAAVAE